MKTIHGLVKGHCYKNDRDKLSNVASGYALYSCFGDTLSNLEGPLSLTKESPNQSNEVAELEGFLFCLKNISERFNTYKNIYIYSNHEIAIGKINGTTKIKVNQDLITFCNHYIQKIQKHGCKLKFHHLNSKKNYPNQIWNQLQRNMSSLSDNIINEYKIPFKPK